MTCMKTICIISICLISASIAVGQTAQDVLQYEHILDQGKKTRKQWGYAYENRNEIQMFFSALFLGYKWMISSQDGVNCTFTPSCSEYGMLAIKKYGAFKGIPMTFDRLTRCHGFNAKDYKLDEHNHLKTDYP